MIGSPQLLVLLCLSAFTDEIDRGTQAFTVETSTPQLLASAS